MLRERIFPPHTIPSSVLREQKEKEKRPAYFLFSEAGGVQQFYRVVGWVALTCDPPGATKDVTRPAPEAGKNAKILPRRMMIKETPPAVRLSIRLSSHHPSCLFVPPRKQATATTASVHPCISNQQFVQPIPIPRTIPHFIITIIGKYPFTTCQQPRHTSPELEKINVSAAFLSPPSAPHRRELYILATSRAPTAPTSSLNRTLPQDNDDNAFPAPPPYSFISITP
ncbi:hypothetical protein BDD12DRAFT_809128 [Trichophaea hybrida]|nr:hypothetical protein BDD12DRAFT_809128 [Trichophaea hybrida]